MAAPTQPTDSYLQFKSSFVDFGSNLATGVPLLKPVPLKRCTGRGKPYPFTFAAAWAAIADMS